MEHDMPREIVVTVTLEDRGDAGLRVWSEALPGLVLSGPDKHAICDAIAPSIQAIMEYQGHTVLGVRSSKPLREVVRQPTPRRVDMHIDQLVQVHHEQFVVELRDAA